MSRQARYRLAVAGVTAAILLGTFAVSWVIGGLLGESYQRPEPEPRPTGEKLPAWYGDLFGDGGDD